MTADERLAFGAFRFDGRSGRLWRDGDEVKLTPRAAAVLRMLAERAPELVTKQELFDRVWGGIAVGDDALTSCIQELRGAMGDDARRPATIETRHRRGYRLMMPATAIADRGGPYASPAALTPEPARLVGRSAALAALARAFDDARMGQRQVVFVTGEPGIGKSTLAEAFLEQLRNARAARIAHGQCLDHHGVGEPYLPLIEALTRLARAADGAAVKEILASQAPSWLAQMPSLWTRAERGMFEARGRATRERMLRELTHAIEAIAADVPLALELEDIHWSDASTLDWIAHMARRPEPARLLLLATFRPADAAAARVGLDRIVTELALHGRCRDIALNPLGIEAIETYLNARLREHAGAVRAREMAPLLLERTGGNPLFMTSIVSQLATRAADRTLGAIMAIPHDVRRFIDRQIDELDPGDRDLLAAASVIRREFATAAVAAALGTEIDGVETACRRLARQGVFILTSASAGTPSLWPDGTAAELYAFRHDLHRELLYDRLPATRRALAHARVGRRLEAAWAGRLDVIAAELAEHFDRGNEPARAIPHHRRAAAKALRRAANEEAIDHLRRALDAIGTIADADERAATEVGLRIALGAAHMAIRGFGAAEVLEAYARAEALCEGLGERADIFPALWGQWLFRWGRSEMESAWRLCERLLAMAEKSADAGLRIQAHHAAWATSFGRGDLQQVHVHAEAGLAVYDPRIHPAMASSYGNHDASCCGRYFRALAFALAGEADHALAMADSAIAFARELSDPFSLALALYFASATAQMTGDLALAIRHAETSRQLAEEHDLALPKAWSTGVLGSCIAASGEPDRGIAMLTEAVATLETTQSRHFMSYQLCLLAQAQIESGRHADAMKVIEQGLALADGGGERYYGAELHRLKGELLARSSSAQKSKAQDSFRTAVGIAQQQGAAMLERRANDSLCRWGG
ncbi:MAG TPA: AAA family ATPase [Xanthobacteraceae bacterium]|nr:AAA family ATPase [Xanthobacteraceae bacterium]